MVLYGTRSSEHAYIATKWHSVIKVSNEMHQKRLTMVEVMEKQMNHRCAKKMDVQIRLKGQGSPDLALIRRKKD